METETGDTDLLLSLGTNVVDQEVFENQLYSRLEQRLREGKEELAKAKAAKSSSVAVVEVNKVNPNEDVQDKGTLNTASSLRVDSNISRGSTAERDELDVEGQRPRVHFAEEVQVEQVEERGQRSSLSLSKGSRKIFVLSADDPEEEETEHEKLIRLGEITPFGTEVEELTNKKNSFLEFNKYLEDQLKLQQMRKKRAVGKKGQAEQSGSSSSQGNGKKHKKKGSGKKNPLDMNVMFPKKRKRKEKLGTEVSEDPRDSRKRVGKSVAETTSMYLNSSDDSEYVPTDSEESDDQEPGCSKNIRKSVRKLPKQSKKIVEKSSGEESSDYDSDTERPTKRLRKEADDGDIKYYYNRVQQWKENETRFTGEFKKIDDGFKVPIHLWESLYTYQKVGVKWLWELHQQRCGGILGDEMGLGKTIQMINFLAGISCSNMLYRFSEYRGLGPVLLITPATVMHQWVKEFHTWWPPFRITVLHESGSYSGTKSTLIKSVQDGNSILITSYSGLVNNQDEILKFPWHYVILDEGHKIRNPDAQITLVVKQVRTPHRIILSGSPLQNNLKELWSLFDFVYPGKLGTLPTFMEQFAVPITHGGYSNATEVQVACAYKCAKALRDMINPYLLRRMKSDVKTHINLPEKSEQVLFCKMTDDQKELYKSYVNSKEIYSIIQGKHNLFVGLINLRKICNHPHIFDGGPKTIQDNPRFQKQIPKVKSGLNSIKDVAVDVDDPIVLDDEGSDIELDSKEESFGHWSKSGKMIVVETLLRLWHSQGHKVLLFTQSRQMLCILENFVRQCKYKYLRMDGSTTISSRQPLIGKFNEDTEVFVFLLTTRVGGLGVNLTAANRVLLYDPDWNPSTDIQARERAWRIGQLRQVTIYRLILSGTIEEKMYHRQVFKQFLTNRVLKDPKQKRFFKSNDLLELFTFNEGSKGTESEAIFAGTGSAVKPKSKRKVARERASGKFKDIPNLVKQKVVKQTEEETAAEENNTEQDEYVLRSLFKKSGVEAALRHDRIVDTDEADYMIVEKEAEQVAKRAIDTLKRSREECWSAESGNANWTGNQGQIKQVQKLRFGKKKPSGSIGNKASSSKPSVSKSDEEEEKNSKYFSGPSIKETETKKSQMSSSDLLAIIRSRKSTEPDFSNNNGDPLNPSDTGEVKSEELELLRDIREFIAFQSTVDGQSTTDEIIERFGKRLPGGQTPLFKQMLSQLCTFRKVEGRGIWRLKPEFR